MKIAHDLDLGSGHTAYIVHHSSTSTYMPNFNEIDGTFRGWTDVCSYVHKDRRTSESHFIRSTQKSRPKKHLSKLHGPTTAGGRKC